MTLAPVTRQLAAAALAQLGLFAGLSALVGLGPVGWCTGIAYAGALGFLVARAFHRAGAHSLGPADRVTLARAVLAGGVTALVVDGWVGGGTPVVVLVGLASLALALDAVDGYVARRSRTASAVGARFDMEVDAFLLLVLSLHVAGSLGAWTATIGLLRYVFVAAGWVLPWLRGPLPVRYSAKAIAALQGIVLVVAASEVLPAPLAAGLVAVALGLLVWSFGRSVAWLRRAARVREDAALDRSPSGLAVLRRRVLALGLTVLAGLIVVVVLLLPGELEHVTPAAFLRLPIEAVLGLGLVVTLPERLRSPAATLAGGLLALLTVATLFDLGFSAVLGRPFDAMRDWPLLGSATDFVVGSFGATGATVALAGTGALLVVIPLLTTWSVRRLARAAAARRTVTLRAVALLTATWLVLAILGVQVAPGTSLAAASTVDLVRERALQVRAGLADRSRFAEELAVDEFRDVPDEDLLAALRGKDVVIAFVESYGRSAVEAPVYASGVGRVLDEGTERLAAGRFAARSAFLTSPTAGGSSWLAHATFLSGLWIDNEHRHRTLLRSDRMTLTQAFGRAGWRAVAVMPGTVKAWDEDAAFYGYDQVYDYPALGYRGPDLGWATMPDQYTLAAFERFERGRTDRPPLLAEIALVSSHAPWAAVPGVIGWDEVGDGSVYQRLLTTGDRDAIWTKDPETIRATYRGAIEYSLASLISYVETYGDDNLVMVILGDHQPAPLLTGEDAGRDVPITIITRDRAVLDRIADWNWQEGLRPGPQAPVWPMDTFRDRFLGTFSTSPKTA